MVHDTIDKESSPADRCQNDGWFWVMGVIQRLHFNLTFVGTLFFLFVFPCLCSAEPSRQTNELSESMQRYHACIVKYVQPAQSAVAAKYLQQACQQIYPLDKSSSKGKKKSDNALVYDLQQTDDFLFRSYYNCLLQYLPLVQNDQSANAMYQLCKERFYPVSEPSAREQRRHKFFQFLGLGEKKTKSESPDLAIEGDAFVPLVPWQAGK